MSYERIRAEQEADRLRALARELAEALSIKLDLLADDPLGMAVDSAEAALRKAREEGLL